MRFAIGMALWWLFVACVAGCGTLVLQACAWDKVNPDIYKPTPDNPCGTVEHACLDMNGKPALTTDFKHLCCPEGTTCGGGMGSVGCPANACCNIRMPPVFMSRDDSGVKDEPQPTVVIVKPQRKAP